MKKSSIFLIFWLVTLQIYRLAAKEVKFVSQPIDSLLLKTYCWQPANVYRPIVPLDGEWEYKIKEKAPFAKVVLPASCNYWGEITFRKSFVPDSTFSNHFFRLVCYGINYSCRVFINEKFIGSHSGGYSSFAFDIADGIIHLNQKNIIEIKVDTRLDSKRTIPHRFQPEGIKNTAGIFRSLYLLAIPEMSFEDVVVDYQLEPGFSECNLEINFQLKDRIDDNSDQNTKKGAYDRLVYYIQISEKNGVRPILEEWKEIDVANYVLTRTISTRLKLKQPQLWSPDSPFLYSIRIQLLQKKEIIDHFDQSLGIKQINFRDGNIYLNGNRFVIKGVNWVEDYLIDGAIFDRYQLQKDLDLTKQLYANAIRVVNHPAHPVLTTLCDSLGLLLLQEIPLDWIPTQRFVSDIFINHCVDYLNETVNRDKAHVSVLAWGVGGNFLFSDPQSKNFLNKITNAVNAINRQFFYFWNSPPLSTGESNSNIIAGISIFNLEKNQIQHDLSQWIMQNSEKTSFVLSYGAPQLATSSSNDNNAIFEEYQVLQIVEAWQAINSFPEIDGYFLSTLSDYQGNYASTIFKNYMPGNLRHFGLTDLSRKKRAAFETIRSLYQEGKTRYNPGIDMKDALPIEFPVAGLGAIFIFLFMVNSRRYFRENFKRIFVHPHGFYVDIRDKRKIPASHTVAMAIFISIGCGLILASLLSFLKNRQPIDHLMTILLPTENLKMKLCFLSWNPGWAILFFTGLSLLVFFLIALYFKIISLVTRKGISFFQSLTMPFWIGGNFMLLMPVGIVLFRLLQYEQLIVPSFIIIAIILLWFFFRMAKGMRVLFIWTMHRALFVLVFTTLVILGGILYYYQNHYALIDYLKFYFQIYDINIITPIFINET